MSARSRRLRLSPQAQRDLRNIRLYGLEQWGEPRASAYLRSLNNGLGVLRTSPRLGVARDNLLPGLRAFVVERHVLYYRLTDATIEVLRILHERADPTRHLQP